MKKIFLSLLFVLLSIPAFAQGIYLPVASGTVTQANMKISAVDGTSFIDFTAANVLTGKTGNLLVVRDSAGRAIQGFIKAAGAGETTGSELINTWANDSVNPWETLITSGSSITSAINTSGSGWAAKSSLGLAGALHKLVIDLTLNSGGPVQAKYWLTTPITYTLSAGNLTKYITPELATVLHIYSLSNTDMACDVSFKQILTPSATGVTITSTKGGTAYNWAQKDSSFNYNDASGYTYQIYKVLDAPVVASGSITAGNALIDATTANAFAAPVGVDLSAYQTGKHLLALYDSSGYAAIGWISATAPSGEALGSEIITNGDMELDSTWISFNYPTVNERSTEQAHTGTYSRKIVATGLSGIQNGEFTLTAQKLYKCAVWLYGDGTHNLVVRVRDSLVGTSFYAFGSSDTGVSVPAAWTKNTSEYFNQLLTGTRHTVRFYVGSGMSSTTFYADDISIKQVTMPAATGALLLSTKGGSRGFMYKHASFNPNAAMTYKVLYVGD